MVEIDYKKLILSMANKDIVGINFASCVQDCLRRQNICIKDGDFDNILKDFDIAKNVVTNNVAMTKITKGNWYRCIEDIGEFVKGRYYESLDDGWVSDTVGHVTCHNECFEPVDEVCCGEDYLKPMFRKGDTIRFKDEHEFVDTIIDITDKIYVCKNVCLPIRIQDEIELVSRPVFIREGKWYKCIDVTRELNKTFKIGEYYYCEKNGFLEDIKIDSIVFDIGDFFYEWDFDDIQKNDYLTDGDVVCKVYWSNHSNIFCQYYTTKDGLYTLGGIFRIYDFHPASKEDIKKLEATKKEIWEKLADKSLLDEKNIEYNEKGGTFVADDKWKHDCAKDIIKELGIKFSIWDVYKIVKIINSYTQEKNKGK